MTAFRSLEDIVPDLPGWIEVHCVSAPDYPLRYSGQSVVVFVWIAPWAPQFLLDSLNGYLELDASFEALNPDGHCVPTVVSRKVGVPLGLVICPTERTAMYEAFASALGPIKGIFNRHLVQEGVLQKKFLELPLLSDQGSALRAFAREFTARHYFCFRHLLESLGSNTFLALLARRLLFIASEEHYNNSKASTFEEFGWAIRLGQVTNEGQQRFCDLFGLTVTTDGTVVETDPDRFRGQALWGTRRDDGVAACTNHVEGLHGRLNAVVKPRRLLVRRMWLLVLALRKKASRFHLNVSRSAKATLKRLQEQGAIVTARPNCGCGWGAVYAARFQIPDFPCVHSVHARTPVVPVVESLDLQWNSPRSITVHPYVGDPWPLGKDRPKIHPPIAEFEDLRPGIPDPLGEFIQQVKHELSMMFPRNGLTHEQLALDLGGFIRKRTGRAPLIDGSALKDGRLRTKFQLRWLTRLRRGKQQEAQGNE
jgi:hypothetical protein